MNRLLTRLVSKPNGFSLLEIMVALGLSGIVALAVMQLTKMQSQSSAYFEDRAEEVQLMQRMNHFLSDAAKCEKTFAYLLGTGTIPKPGDPPLELTTFVDQNNRKYVLNQDLIVDPGDVSLTRKRLTKVEVRNPRGIGWDTGTSAYVKDRGELLLKFFFDRYEQGLGPSKGINKDLFVDVITNPSGKVAFCFSDTDSAIKSAHELTCKEMGGEYTEPTDPDEKFGECKFQFDLHLGQHSQQQCLSAGGVPTPLPIPDPPGTAMFCRVATGADGTPPEAFRSWNPHANWSTTVPGPLPSAPALACKPDFVTVDAFNINQILAIPDWSLIKPYPFTNPYPPPGCPSTGHSWSNTPRNICEFECRHPGNLTIKVKVEFPASYVERAYY